MVLHVFIRVKGLLYILYFNQNAFTVTISTCKDSLKCNVLNADLGSNYCTVHTETCLGTNRQQTQQYPDLITVGILCCVFYE